MATIGSLVLSLEARTSKLESQLKQAQGYIKQLTRQIEATKGSVASVEGPLVSSFRRMGLAMQQTQDTSARFLSTLRLLAGVASVGFAGRLIQQSVQLGDSISDMAQQVDVSAESLQRLRFVAEQTGGSSELLDRGLNILNERLGAAAAGSTEAQKAFEALGLRWQDLQKMGVEGALLAIADALGRFPDAADRAARQAGVFGERNRALANFLALGSQRIRELGEDAQRTGAILDERTVTALARANDQLSAMATRINAQVAIAVAGLVPHITAVAESVERMTTALKDGNAELRGLTATESLAVKIIQSLAFEFRTVADAVKAAAEGVEFLSRLLKGLPTHTGLTQEIRLAEQALDVATRAPAAGQDPAKIAAVRETLKNLRLQRQVLEAPIGFPLESAMGRGPGAEFLLPPPRLGKPPKPPGDLAGTADAKKRLADLDKSLAESRRELEGWAAVMEGLGQPIDVTTERINFLSTAIRARLKEGIPPTAAAIRQLTAELAGLQQHAGDFALAESRRELDGWAAVMASLGQPIDQTTARIGYLETAIRTKLKAGIPPTNAAIRQLTAELAGLQQHAGDFALAESRRELDGWAAVMASLGQPIDQTTQKISDLETVIRAKLKAGIPPTAAVMKALTAELKALQDQAARTALREADFAAMAETPEGPDLDAIFKARRQSLQALADTTKAFGDTTGGIAKRVDIFRESLEQARVQGVSPLDPALQHTRQEILKLEQVMAALEGRAFPSDTIRDRLRDLDTSITGSLRKTREELQLTQQQLLTLQEAFPQYGAEIQRAQRAVNIELARTTLVGQGLEIVAQGLTDAFDATFQGIIQGTLSVSEAFKNMVQSILLSISKLLIQKGIMLLLDVALSGLVRPTGAPVAGGGTEILLQHGGPVPGLRSAADDSILARLSPREFVLRRQAVDVLGEDFLQQLNDAPRDQLHRLHRLASTRPRAPMGTPRLDVAQGPRGRLQRQPIDTQLLGLLRVLPRLPRFQQGGPVTPRLGAASPFLNAPPPLPLPQGVQATQRQQQAPVQITHTAIVVRNEQEAQAKRQELELFENQIVTVVTKQILAGDGSMINRSLRMVHGGR